MKIIESNKKIPVIFFDNFSDDDDLKRYNFDINLANKYKDKIISFQLEGRGAISEKIPNGFTDVVIIDSGTITYLFFTKNLNKNDLIKILDFN